MPQRKAFTLIELLVVIAIVSILSGFVFIQTNNAINSGKDAKRKSDVELLSSALISYSTEHYNAAPVTDFDGCTINGDCPAEVNEAFEVYIGTLPAEPNSGAYYTYQSDGTDCTISASLSTGETYQYICSTDDTIVGSPVAGTCGSKANSSSSGYPSSQTDWTINTTYCASTTPSTTPAFPATAGSSVSWSCPGTYLGGTVSCTAYRAADGSCGSATANTYTIPTTNFCSTGTASSISGSGPWTWNCAGVYGGTTASCTANKSIDGVCGSSNTANLYTIPSTNLCTAGTASSVSGTGPWTWTCVGEYDGTTASCSANKKVDGACGSSNGSNFYSAPTTNLCSAGTETAVSGSGPWSWSCTGQNTGSTAPCSANLIVDGVCGAAATAYSYSVSSWPAGSVFCSTGTASPASPTFPSAGGSTSWSCLGANGGSSPTCTASRSDKDLCNNLHSTAECSAAGGSTFYNSVGSCTACRFNGSSCPSGWGHLGYTATSATYCSGDCFSNQCYVPHNPVCNFSCGCTTSSHSLAYNVAAETCGYVANGGSSECESHNNCVAFPTCDSCYAYPSRTCTANVTAVGCN